MFSGKTSELLARVSAVAAPQRQVFKHDRDHRYRRAAVVTHAGQAIPAQPVTRARDLLPQLRPNTRLVALDEAHFFGGDLLDVADVLRIRGIEFLITALDVDSWGRVFPVLEELRALADEVVLLRATCARCGAVAVRTQRTAPIRGADYTAGQNAECLLIGGAEAFEPRCVACWSPPPEAPPTLPVPQGAASESPLHSEPRPPALDVAQPCPG
jgi:thymidine kinase